MKPRKFSGLLLAAIVLAIAVATLRPGGGSSGGGGFCLLCGQREIADLVSNILLFAPFGIVLAWRGATVRQAFVAGVVFSGLIEAAQVWVVAGRDANVG